MDERGALPVMAAGFSDGTQVFVTGGRYDGDHGEVVNRAPDLRPGSVWVMLDMADTHLVPAYRLAQCGTDHCHHDHHHDGEHGHDGDEGESVSGHQSP